jgi:hypothetical protein
MMLHKNAGYKNLVLIYVSISLGKSAVVDIEDYYKVKAVRQ